MSWNPCAYLEVRSHGPDGREQWEELCSLRLDQADGLGLYDLTGLKGADPPYEVGDASRRISEHYAAALEDTATTKLLKIDGDAIPDLGPLAAQWPRPPSTRLKAALQMLAALGSDGRLLFWIDA